MEGGRGKVQRTFQKSREKDKSEDIALKPAKDEPKETQEKRLNLKDNATNGEYRAALEDVKALRAEIFRIAETEFGAKDVKRITEAVEAFGELPRPGRKSDDNQPVDGQLVRQFNEASAKLQKIKIDYEQYDEQVKGERMEASKSLDGARPWRNLINVAILQYAEHSGILDFKLVKEKLSGAKFGWTNVKGAVGEALAAKQISQHVESIAKDGRERHMFSLEIIKLKDQKDKSSAPEKKTSKKAENTKEEEEDEDLSENTEEREEDPYRSIAEIDNAVLLKEKSGWTLESIFESKSDANADAPNALVQLGKKKNRLRNLREGEMIWTKDGSTRVRDITNILFIENDVNLISIGPKAKHGRQFLMSYAPDYTLEEITDQLAIDWLEKDQSRTMANVMLGTGAEKSALSGK
jgi:hypothetical protein